MRTALLTARRDAVYRGLAYLMLFTPLALSLSISFAITPQELESGAVVLSPPCMSQLLFARPCPTCGMTRGFAAVSHGRFEQALHYNRAAPIVYLLYWTGAALGLVGAIRSGLAYRRMAPRRER